MNVQDIFTEVRKGAKKLANTDNNKRNLILDSMAKNLLLHEKEIIKANEADLERMDDRDPKKDRLLLNEKRINDLAESIKEIMTFDTPDRKILSQKSLNNGIELSKISVPVGVVAAVYESRPNVTVDIAALCIKSGNGCILRGGTDAFNTNSILVSIIQNSLKEHDFPDNVVLLYPPDRALIQELLTAERYIDLIIPRGSSSLIEFVRKNSTIPTIETGAGVCHTYVSDKADITKAAKITENAKVSRPSVCNSLDCILLHKSVAQPFLEEIYEGFASYHVEIFADYLAYNILNEMNYPYLQKTSEGDYGREFLDFKCSIKTVDSTFEALDHIEKYSSRHSEVIVSEDKEECNLFINSVDAAAVYSNASSRFTDGGVFGLGAEIGISTQKLHARGPFGLEKLVTEKWIGRGSGQIRN
jgi:glutamate-5-semialdehyde dehydrogenase